MGSLPPNVVPDSPRDAPAPRMVELYCTTRGVGTYWPADFGGTGAPLAGTTYSYRYDTNAITTLWDAVRYDYEGSVARSNSLSGSGPYLKGSPSTGLIYLTAPYDRPLPYIATFNCSIYHGGGTSATAETGGIAIGRAKGGYPTVSHRTLAGQLLTSGRLYYTDPTSTTWDRPIALVGMDIVPPGQTYVVYIGWFSSNSGIAAAVRFNIRVPNVSLSTAAHPTFSVMTF